jgi:hypothetical protein
VELRRNEPGAPDLPPVLRPSFEAALGRARELARELLARDADPHGKLAVADAVFRGDFTRARALLDSEETEDGE